MKNDSDQKKLISILQNAYSGEQAAAYAYRGHWRSLKNHDEILNIQKIEKEEWEHRRRVGLMLMDLGSEPDKIKELYLTLIGKTIAFLCHIIGWFLAMYFAGKIESSNVREYEDAAFYAGKINRELIKDDLLVMAEVEKEHELFFKNIIARHPMLPVTRFFFKWG
jgi:demethoxyubiquinone hydroxylase (CLK1/Coq7/Cat5 family)